MSLIDWAELEQKWRKRMAVSNHTCTFGLGNRSKYYFCVCIIKQFVQFVLYLGIKTPWSISGICNFTQDIDRKICLKIEISTTMVYPRVFGFQIWTLIIWWHLLIVLFVAYLLRMRINSDDDDMGVLVYTWGDKGGVERWNNPVKMRIWVPIVLGRKT